MTYEYTGILESIGQTQAVGQKGFTKREIVVGRDVGDNSKYPNPVKFTLKKDKCALADHLAKGQRVKVAFVVDGRRWDGPRGTQYFVDLTALKVDVVAADGAGSSAPDPAAPETIEDVEPDDMPF